MWPQTTRSSGGGTVGGIDASYTDVLEALASTQADRRGLLAPFFERTADDLDTGAKLPSDAHRELARLVKRGFVRIIVTLNFDHLMEEALRDEGIEPTFVSGPAAIEAMEPLHAQRCVVVHLHGDYLSPDLLNTAGELATYPEPVKRLIRQVAGEYGLIVVGWSAAWDSGLVELLTPVAEPRFATWWIEPGELNPTQTRLVSSRRAEVIEFTADEALPRLAVSLGRGRRGRRTGMIRSTSQSGRVDEAELRTGDVGIRSHDLIRRALGVVGESAVIHPADYQAHGRPPDFTATQTEAVLSELRAAAAYVAILAYWGDERTDRWWFDDLERLGWRPHQSGLSDLIDLARSPSVVLCYSAGAAAVAAERWSVVMRLLVEPTPRTAPARDVASLSQHFTPDSCGIAGGSTRAVQFRRRDCAPLSRPGSWPGHRRVGALRIPVRTHRHERHLPAVAAVHACRGHRSVREQGDTGALARRSPECDSALSFSAGMVRRAQVTRRRSAFDAAFGITSAIVTSLCCPAAAASCHRDVTIPAASTTNRPSTHGSGNRTSDTSTAGRSGADRTMPNYGSVAAHSAGWVR